MNNIVSQFVGLQINEVLLNPDNSEITVTFQRTSKKLLGQTEADCCSNTWIEHTNIPPDIHGAIFIDIEDGGTINVEDKDYDVITVYETTIRTSRGLIILEYRNESNGYYGGNIRWEVLNV